jgi:Cu/Ag efflux pump CusA
MKEVLLNICLVAAAAGIFKLLAPERIFKSQISFLISCFFIVSVITIISQGKYEFSEIAKIKTPDIADFSNQMLIEEKNAVASEIEKRLTEKLKENGVSVKKITVNINISPENRISISDIKVVLENENEEERTLADKIIKEELEG